MHLTNASSSPTFPTPRSHSPLALVLALAGALSPSPSPALSHPRPRVSLSRLCYPSPSPTRWSLRAPRGQSFDFEVPVTDPWAGLVDPWTTTFGPSSRNLSTRGSLTSRRRWKLDVFWKLPGLCCSLRSVLALLGYLGKAAGAERVPAWMPLVSPSPRSSWGRCWLPMRLSATRSGRAG